VLHWDFEHACSWCLGVLPHWHFVVVLLKVFSASMLWHHSVKHVQVPFAVDVVCVGEVVLCRREVPNSLGPYQRQRCVCTHVHITLFLSSLQNCLPSVFSNRQMGGQCLQHVGSIQGVHTEPCSFWYRRQHVTPGFTCSMLLLV
jgi:hypothetical protein